MKTTARSYQIVDERMTIISSQRFRDSEIVEQKVEMLRQSGVECVEIPVIRGYMTDFDGNELFAVVDKHHTLSAAIILGLKIEFVEVNDEFSYYGDIENQNGEAVLEANYLGDAWYYIDIEEEDGIGADVW